MKFNEKKNKQDFSMYRVPERNNKGFEALAAMLYIFSVILFAFLPLISFIGLILSKTMRDVLINFVMFCFFSGMDALALIIYVLNEYFNTMKEREKKIKRHKKSKEAKI